MSRTKRRKRWGQSGTEADGKGGQYKGGPTSEDLRVAVRRPERRELQLETDKLANAAVDADDVSVKPKRRHLWQFWRSW